MLNEAQRYINDLKIIEPTNLVFRARIKSTDGLFTTEVKKLAFVELVAGFGERFQTQIAELTDQVNKQKVFLRKQYDLRESTETEYAELLAKYNALLEHNKNGK